MSNAQYTQQCITKKKKTQSTITEKDVCEITKHISDLAQSLKRKTNELVNSTQSLEKNKKELKKVKKELEKVKKESVRKDTVIECPLCRTHNIMSEKGNIIKGSHTECSVCMSENVEILLPDCGHACLCKTCFDKMKNK